MLEQLRAKNKINILPVTHKAFEKFGKVVEGYEFSPLIHYLQTETAIPESGNLYLAGDSAMEAMPICEELTQGFYGSFPVQIGYCNGKNSKLNALEYHKSSELDIAVTPMVLLLAELSEIRENTLPVSVVTAWYLPAGTAVELYETTLHFSPCKVCETGFKSVIILPKGTNLPLGQSRPDRTLEDKLLWMTNKWLIAHSESVPASKGAWVGITGENLEIYY